MFDGKHRLRTLACFAVASLAMLAVVSVWKSFVVLFLSLIAGIPSGPSVRAAGIWAVALVPPVEDVTRTGFLAWLGGSVGGSLQSRCLFLALFISVFEFGRMVIFQQPGLAMIMANGPATDKATVGALLVLNFPARLLFHFTFGYVQAKLWPVSMSAFLTLSGCHAGVNTMLALQNADGAGLAMMLLMADCGVVVVSLVAWAMLSALRPRLALHARGQS